mmetsp:Transcript_61934/g.152497  ORF Transcript_61934/g.152497 Transcript_61934/m.152497 type:complete len:313 (-) Transcript_61934:434-1372(-)
MRLDHALIAPLTPPQSVPRLDAEVVDCRVLWAPYELRRVRRALLDRLPLLAPVLPHLKAVLLDGRAVRALGGTPSEQHGAFLSLLRALRRHRMRQRRRRRHIGLRRHDQRLAALPRTKLIDGAKAECVREARLQVLNHLGQLVVPPLARVHRHPLRVGVPVPPLEPRRDENLITRDRVVVVVATIPRERGRRVAHVRALERRGALGGGECRALAPRGRPHAVPPIVHPTHLDGIHRVRLQACELARVLCLCALTLNLQVRPVLELVLLRRPRHKLLPVVVLLLLADHAPCHLVLLRLVHVALRPPISPREPQ